jgi:hypothetical protein
MAMTGRLWPDFAMPLCGSESEKQVFMDEN